MLQLGGRDFRNLNAQLASRFLNDPMTIESEHEQLTDTYFRRDFTEMLQPEIAQALRQIGQTDLFAVPTLQSQLKVEHCFIPLPYYVTSAIGRHYLIAVVPGSASAPISSNNSFIVIEFSQSVNA